MSAEMSDEQTRIVTYKTMWVPASPFKIDAAKYKDGISVWLPHQCDEWEIVGRAPTVEAAAKVLREFASDLLTAAGSLEELIGGVDE